MAEEYRENFINTYTKFVLPMLFDFEKYRKRSVFLLILSECTVVILWIVLCLFLYKSNIFNNLEIKNKVYYILYLALALIVPFEFIFYKFRSRFKRKLKTDVGPKMIYAFGNMEYGEYTLESKLKKLIESSKLFNNLPKECEFYFDDTFTGEHCGIDYDVAEADIIIPGKRPIQVFKGVIFSFVSNKKILASTNIYPSNYKLKDNIDLYVVAPVLLIVSSLVGFVIAAIITNFKGLIFHIFMFSMYALILAIGIFFYHKSRYGKKSKEDPDSCGVNLEDIDFSKRYVVSSEDQVEARYLVTPSFIERFQALEKVYCAKNIRCAFHDNKILFAIATNKDLFEFGSLFHSLTDTKQIENFYNEMKVIFDIMELFKLDEKTGL